MFFFECPVDHLTAVLLDLPPSRQPVVEHVKQIYLVNLEATSTVGTSNGMRLRLRPSDGD